MKIILNSALFLFITTVILGFAYPLAVKGIGDIFFSNEVKGSILKNGEQEVGSTLIGQEFLLPKYFQGRPSACHYDASSSCATNYGALHPDFIKAVRERMNSGEKESDMLTASGSGLDPHVSLQTAMNQVPRIAKERNLSKGALESLIMESVEKRTFDLLGQERINVLQLNLKLDHL